MSPDKRLNSNGFAAVPASMLQTFRTALAVQDGCERNLLFRTWGGLGDQICAEPTLRYALKAFKDCDISLASERPELFRHLDFKEVYDLRKVQPRYENFMLFDTIVPPTHLVWEFVSHMMTNCVDFPSICALRSQLPIKDREVQLQPTHDEVYRATCVFLGGENRQHLVAVHPGKHWASKTFPAEWWNDVLMEIKKAGKVPVLIGADTDDNRSTVAVDRAGCIDLRSRLSVMESVALLQYVPVLLTNDSSPLHMAASGNAWIGYVATCKHPDFITHWRRGQWGWRMQNFGKGGIWDIISHCPNTEQEVTAEFVDPEILKSWLPEPADIATWATERASQ